MAMPRPSKSKILKKVLSHLRRDIKEQNVGAKEDEELIENVKTKEKTRPGKKK